MRGRRYEKAMTRQVPKVQTRTRDGTSTAVRAKDARWAECGLVWGGDQTIAGFLDGRLLGCQDVGLQLGRPYGGRCAGDGGACAGLERRGGLTVATGGGREEGGGCTKDVQRT